MKLDLDRVPTSFEEALRLLDSALTEQEKTAWTSMTAAKMFDLQARLAKVLKHEWSLDDETTPLPAYFCDLGLDDSDEVSLLLLDAYWRQYNKEAFTVKELVNEYLED
jgi:hypothetical protein